MTTPIFGPTRSTPAQVEKWMRGKNAHQRFIDTIPIWFELAPIYEIPAENAIGQAAHETGHGHYTGQVPPHYHNWCGLKTKNATGDKPEDHQVFPDDRTGIEAHLQHLRRYGKRVMPPGRTLVDPRWHLVTAFTDSMEGLGGSWAPSPSYGNKVVAQIKSLMATVVEDNGVAAQIPGFAWHPADNNHFQSGRSERIRGGAQHYTAGTNSLNWLSTTSNPPVSATFLVKHNPTMEDRGWQIVRIEDTAWTTSRANAYTVSIEYEHKSDQSIPDIAYEVLAQTWVDINQYCVEHNLGVIAEIKGHKDWVPESGTVCPDGIDVARIVRRFEEIIDGPAPPDEIPFDTGHKLVGAMAGFYRIAESAGIHWSAIGVPTGDMYEFTLDDEPVLVQSTDVGWIVYKPSNGETRMATKLQQEQIHDDISDSDKKLLEILKLTDKMKAVIER